MYSQPGLVYFGKTPQIFLVVTLVKGFGDPLRPEEVLETNIEFHYAVIVKFTVLNLIKKIGTVERV